VPLIISLKITLSMSSKQDSKNSRQKTTFTVAVSIGAFLIGSVLASLFWYFHLNAVIANISKGIKPLRQNNNPYTYINPLLGYEVPGNIKEFNEYKPLAQKVAAAVTQANTSNLDNFSIYFRDLTSGRWSGSNENVTYSPGSMMKVAIMIAYFKEAENDPTVLQKMLPYTNGVVAEANSIPFSDTSSLVVGQNYSVEDLIEAMIINSDNGAKNVLLDNINSSSFVEVHTDLGLPNPLQVQNYVISAKQYSLLLRVLYNATYLSRQYSEKALQIMSKAKYNQGLVAGLPPKIVAAQKFGEAVDINDPTEIDLSDCGVIYHPTNPYILCVMTKGKDVATLTKTIALISQTVWNEVQSYSSNAN
jgi:beta-lactamase class A